MDCPQTISFMDYPHLYINIIKNIPSLGLALSSSSTYVLYTYMIIILFNLVIYIREIAISTHLISSSDNYLKYSLSSLIAAALYTSVYFHLTTEV